VSYRGGGAVLLLPAAPALERRPECGGKLSTCRHVWKRGTTMTRCRAAVVAALVLLCNACGGKAPKLDPVRGTVLFQQQPATGATVVFQPVNADAKSLTPSGTVAADGSFTLTTYPYGEGAPAGEYVVLVTWYAANARGVEDARNKLPARYADVSHSPLRATVQ